MNAKEFVRIELEALNSSMTPEEFDHFAELWATEARLIDGTDPEHPASGRAAVRDYCEELKKAMPDFHMEIPHLFQEGQNVTAQIILSGTHTGGNFRGHPARGNKVKWWGCCVYIVSDQNDQILQETYYYDGGGLDGQLTAG
jgi:predicted ester cyclase